MGVLANLLGDARLPTGGHAQSAGLEPAVSAGLRAAQIPGLIAARLRTSGLVDAGTAVVARHHVLTGRSLAGVYDAWAARTPSHVAREAALATGRGYLRLLQRFWPDSAATAAAIAAGPGPVRPLVLGALAAAAELDPETLVRAMTYDEAQTMASAALKLLPLDPLDATGWLLARQPQLDEIVCRVIELTAPDDIPAPAAPQLEQWCLDHARSDRRLFRA